MKNLTTRVKNALNKQGNVLVHLKTTPGSVFKWASANADKVEVVPVDLDNVSIQFRAGVNSLK